MRLATAFIFLCLFAQSGWATVSKCAYHLMDEQQLRETVTRLMDSLHKTSGDEVALKINIEELKSATNVLISQTSTSDRLVIQAFSAIRNSAQRKNNIVKLMPLTMSQFVEKYFTLTDIKQYRTKQDEDSMQFTGFYIRSYAVYRGDSQPIAYVTAIEFDVKNGAIKRIVKKNKDKIRVPLAEAYLSSGYKKEFEELTAELLPMIQKSLQTTGTYPYQMIFVSRPKDHVLQAASDLDVLDSDSYKNFGACLLDYILSRPSHVADEIIHSLDLDRSSEE